MGAAELKQMRVKMMMAEKTIRQIEAFAAVTRRALSEHPALVGHTSGCSSALGAETAAS